MVQPTLSSNSLRVGMVGAGMIFDETYRPVFEQYHRSGMYRHDFGFVAVELAAIASRTGKRVVKYQRDAERRIGPFHNIYGPSALTELLKQEVDVVCIATPDDRHFEAAYTALQHGKHVLIEKPSVLSLQELDQLMELANKKQVLAKVVYHKLLDPDHKKLRTLVQQGIMNHVNNGYCSLLEPKQISGSQFAEWITGRNPGTYVAVHYLKLIDFSFFQDIDARLRSISATGQRGLVGPGDGPTWDSIQLRVSYRYPDHRDATFDIHTSWVTPDNFPGYVEQEVQFRFDNAVWNAHQRKRGVEVTIEGITPTEMKTNINIHYNGTFIEPWGEESQRGYGLEAIQRFFEEVAYVEFGGQSDGRTHRLQQMQNLSYNDLSADRNTVAIVQAMEAILQQAVEGQDCGVVFVNDRAGLSLHILGKSEPMVLYEAQI